MLQLTERLKNTTAHEKARLWKRIQEC
jgi:hypothetical protein